MQFFQFFFFFWKFFIDIPQLKFQQLSPNNVAKIGKPKGK